MSFYLIVTTTHFPGYAHWAKCNIEFVLNSHQKSICCDHCDKYYHLKCTDLTVSSIYKSPTADDHWYCHSCKSTIFPFLTIDNTKLLNCLDFNIYNPQILNTPKNVHTNCG